MLAELPQQAPDGIGGLLYFGIDLFGAGFWIGLGSGTNHAVANVLFNKTQADGVQGFGGSSHLREDVDAVFVLFHHARDTADLPLDAFQAAQVGVLVAGVPVWCGVLKVDFDGREVRAQVVEAQVCIAHASNLYPSGVSNQVPPGGIPQVSSRNGNARRLRVVFAGAEGETSAESLFSTEDT